jgi:hypothetical protein
MADLSAVSTGDGIAFLVAYGIVAEIIAKACSSPQTAELNADKRASTLMKWVWIGVVEAVAAIIVAASIDAKHRTAIIWGGFLAIAITLGEYVYAKRSGLRNGGPATETY